MKWICGYTNSKSAAVISKLGHKYSLSVGTGDQGGQLNYSLPMSVRLTDPGDAPRACRRRRQWVKEMGWEVVDWINPLNTELNPICQ